MRRISARARFCFKKTSMTEFKSGFLGERGKKKGKKSHLPQTIPRPKRKRLHSPSPIPLIFLLSLPSLRLPIPNTILNNILPIQPPLRHKLLGIRKILLGMMRRPLRNLHGGSLGDKHPRNDFSAGLRNSSLEACGDWREIAERFVEDGDEIGRGVVYGG